MNLKEYNKLREEKRNIIIEYYNKKEKEIKEMSEKDFITSYLNKEKSENIKNLMSANINNTFQLDLASTNISNKVDELLDGGNKEEDDDDSDASIKKRIDYIFEKGKNNRVKNTLMMILKLIYFLMNQRN